MKTVLRSFIIGAPLAAAVLFGGTASAHPVGDASEPNCHGQRVSHGASHSTKHGGHGLTPVERRDMVQEFLPFEITVGDWHKHVATCEAPPEH